MIGSASAVSNRSLRPVNDWHTYNFVNYRYKALNIFEIKHTVSSGAPEKRAKASAAPTDPTAGELRIDSELTDPLESNGTLAHQPLEVVRWYLPVPLAELILHCIQTSHKLGDVFSEGQAAQQISKASFWRTHRFAD